MNNLAALASRIIKEQELVIGPLAWNEAKKVSGLTVVDQYSAQVDIANNAPEVVDRLVAQYERLFGRASHEVCREAAAPFLAHMSPTEIPSSLR